MRALWFIVVAGKIVGVKTMAGLELDAADLRCLAALLNRGGYPYPAFRMIGDSVGPYHEEILQSWANAKEGDTCPRCGTLLELDLGGYQCATCIRHRLEALGCRCDGENLCYDCQKAGATDATRGKIKCREGCSSMCHVCFPDD